MNSLFSLAVTSFIVALSGALMPGPLLTATVGESTRQGGVAGPLLIAGHAILEMALLAALCLGAAPLLTNRAATAGISCAGGVVLFLLAWGMYRALPALSIEAPLPKGRGQSRLVLTGMMVSLSNPYWILWWATFGLACILQSRRLGLMGIVAFFIGHISADFSWYSLISFSVAKGRAFFTDKIYRLIVGVCAGFLVLFAGFFLYKGLMQFV